jgi:hypothetical protein
MLPKRRSWIFFTCLFIQVSCTSQAQRDPFVGIWNFIARDVDIVRNPDNLDFFKKGQTKKEPLFKTLRVRKLGKYNVQYYVQYNNRGGETFQVLNDTTLYAISYDTTFLLYNPKTERLKFSETRNDFIGLREHYLPEFERVTYDHIDQSPLPNENFFDFQISHYQSGNLKNGIPRSRLLPFRISPSFIKKRNIRQLVIDIETIDQRGAWYDTARQQAKIEFDAGGHIKKVTTIFEKGFVIYWNFSRRNDAYSSLASIERFAPDTARRRIGLKETETYYYDIDEWPADQAGRKIVDDPLQWTMLDQYLPLKCSSVHLKDGLEFVYQDQQLVKMFILQGEERKTPASFVYTDDGVLRKIVWRYGGS